MIIFKSRINNHKLNINLSFFAGEKTEKPTSKKLSDARKKGDVANSQELNTALSLIFVFFALKIFGAGLINKIREIFMFNFEVLKDIDNFFYTDYAANYVAFIFSRILLAIAPIFGIVLVVGLTANLIQVGWHPTTKPLQPKFSKLNPISGFKRLFSSRAIAELIKSLVKFGIIGYAIYSIIKNEIHMIPLILDMELITSITYVANVGINLAINIGVLYLFIALADIIYVRYKRIKKLRMSKQDIKDEYKNSEGDPRIKSKIRQKMLQASMRRMMNDVPSADVIITNPTHFAVAIKYDKDKSEAPMVVAKGADFLAKKIREKATQNDVQIVENKQLARAIYATVDVGKQIPPELYQAVAEVLAFVYKLKNT